MSSSISVRRLASGASEYTTIDGDQLDGICQKYYGQDYDVPEIVLENNPGLSALGPIYGAGVKIILPAYKPVAPTKRNTFNLWD
jgi:phage tail protein X